MKIKGLKIRNPRKREQVDYTGEFNDTGMNTTIPKDLLDKLGLKPRDSVMFYYKGNHVSTNIGPNGKVGFTRIEVNKLGYMDK